MRHSSSSHTPSRASSADPAEHRIEQGQCGDAHQHDAGRRSIRYDVFDPREVVPEFTADVGLKKGEKIDYAIMRDSEVQMLVECKSSTIPLDLEDASQLFRYFAATNARIALLTNGQVYNFYTDLDAPNRMDDKPFLVLDLTDIDPVLVAELSKLTEETFDLDSVISAAEELKYVSQIKRAIGTEFREPSDDWVKFFTARVYAGSFTQKVREQFTSLVAKAASQYLNDQVNGRLKTALGTSEFTSAEVSGDLKPKQHSSDATENEVDSNSDIVTTPEELEGYAIVKAIGCSEVRPERIASRDAKSYFAILLDDNNRKPIARLHFNHRTQKYIGVFDADKNETRHAIGSLDEIYQFAEVIRASIRGHL
ncbi:MAG: restriction endonuclease [Microbacteriaceae bacterium]|nr:MAG: restriction endonuclease [Microbacteriaceae bacterium]